MNPLREAILEKLPWLITEMGFEVVSYDYSPRTFGNCRVTMDGPAFRIIFVLDRGQVLAGFTPLQDLNQHWDLSYLLEAIHGQMPSTSFDLETIGARLRDNYSALADALGPNWDKTRAELERRGALRLHAMQNPIRPTGTHGLWTRVLAKWLQLKYRWAGRHERG